MENLKLNKEYNFREIKNFYNYRTKYGKINFILKILDIIAIFTSLIGFIISLTGLIYIKTNIFNFYDYIHITIYIIFLFCFTYLAYYFSGIVGNSKLSSFSPFCRLNIVNRGEI